MTKNDYKKFKKVVNKNHKQTSKSLVQILVIYLIKFNILDKKSTKCFFIYFSVFCFSTISIVFTLVMAKPHLLTS